MSTRKKMTKAEFKRRYPKTSYCYYAGTCDKEINCRDGDLCAVFKSTGRMMPYWMKRGGGEK